MIIRKQITISQDVNAEIILHSNDKTVLAVANLGDSQGSILDYYDYAEDAESAIEHFSRCYEIAVEEGFSLMPEFFVHEEFGVRVEIHHALAVHEPVAMFRRESERLKGSSELSM